MPAEKQLYQPTYVLQHFVHYSTVTLLTAMNRTETLQAGVNWSRRTHTDVRSRFANELTERTMLHTKAIATQDTAGWERACRGEGHQTCRIGVPHPEDDEHKKENKDGDGWVYNCYVNQVVENKWVPGLEKSMGLKR